MFAELRIGGAHGRDELVDLAGVLDAFCGLDAGAHVDGQRSLATWPQLRDAVSDVFRVQSTTQDEVSVDAWRQQ